MDYKNLTIGIICLFISIISYFFEDRYINYLKKKSSDLDEKAMKTRMSLNTIFFLFIGIILILASFN